jgi:copper homeostasis protein
MKKILEICCDTLQSVINANKAGADRIELCTALSVGGTTPSLSFVKEAVKISKIPVNVLLRPRAGNFVYSDAEIQIMCGDIHDLKESGAAGIVSGVLQKDGKIDKDKTSRLLNATKPLGFTFHRGIDFAIDAEDAIEFLIDFGAERILTSGGAAKINGGIQKIIELHKKYGDKIIIMPGGGLNEENAEILKNAGVKEFHFSASSFVKENIEYSRRPDGLGHVFDGIEYGYNYSSVDTIVKLLQILR